MVNPFICGSGSFNHQLEEEEDRVFSQSQCSSPRKPRKSSLSRSKDNKNPYAERGLEKFSALLAELEGKRQKIYTQIPSDDISLVRFTHSESNDFKPIVVRVREKKQENNIKNGEHGENKTVPSSTSEASDQKHPVPGEIRNKLGDEKKNQKKSSSLMRMKIDLWKPSFYIPAMLILILLFLALFGRSFAILCTSIGWYLVPTIKKGSSNSKGSAKKKRDYTRRASEKQMIVFDGPSSPKSVLAGAAGNDVSPPRRGCHRKSW